MKLEHEFTVPVPVADAWEVLLDVERVAPCMPGATINSVDGDEFTGTVKVKVGPITISYSGNASFVEKDEAARRVVVKARGKETRGSGTASATVTAQLAENDGGQSTQVSVETDLAITGRPAQFGRGVMDEVGAKLLGQFADCLAGQLSAGHVAPGTAAGEPEPTGTHAAGEQPGGARATDEEPGSAQPGTPGPGDASIGARPGVGDPVGAAVPPAGGMAGQAGPAAGGAAGDRPTPDAINLMGVAGGSIAKRVLPLVGLIVVVVLVWLIVRALRG